MTRVLAARTVLDDCRGALADLEAASPEALRRRWFTAVVLMRTTLHVLDKVDRKQGATVAAAIDANWKDLQAGKPKSSPPIYWELIEPERNSLMKEYKPTPSQDGVRVALRPRGVVGTAAHPVVPAVVAYQARVLAGGNFEGYPLVDVVREGIRWLDSYLDGVDARVERSG